MNLQEICFQHATSFHHALDVGCACGALSFALSERFQRVVGLDTSLSFVQACGTLQQRRAVPYVLPGQQVGWGKGWNGRGEKLLGIFEFINLDDPICNGYMYIYM